MCQWKEMWWNHEWFRCTPSGTVKLRTRTLNSTTHVQSQKIHAAQRVILARVALHFLHSIWKERKDEKKAEKNQRFRVKGISCDTQASATWNRNERRPSKHAYLYCHFRACSREQGDSLCVYHLCPTSYWCIK